MTDRIHIRRHADGEYQVLVDGQVIATLDSSSEATARAEVETIRERAWDSMWRTPFDFSREPK
jgi:hypothetical protein